MRLLLDTQAFLYFVAGSPRMSARARALIEDTSNVRLLSIASVWEIAIKLSVGKLALAQPFAEVIPDQLGRSVVSLLPITIDHTVKSATLPLHHRDPFDRMLIAQAMVEAVPVISNDPAFDLYEIERLW